MGKRRLKNLALDYLMALGDEAWRRRALEQVPLKKKKAGPAVSVSACYDVGQRRVQYTNTYISILEQLCISVLISVSTHIFFREYIAAPAQVYAYIAAPAQHLLKYMRT